MAIVRCHLTVNGGSNSIGFDEPRRMGMHRMQHINYYYYFMTAEPHPKQKRKAKQIVYSLVAMESVYSRLG